nr:MAG TPA: hypothetical protein [Caudoviricetes sp.]
MSECKAFKRITKRKREKKNMQIIFHYIDYIVKRETYYAL